jgi:cyclopropane fatty-acyl-phospholipid synthase-like methyltransferase
MSCNLPLVYDDDTWASIVSPDQAGCNAYIRSRLEFFRGAKVLHVGTGTSSLLVEFHDVFDRLDGITIMQSEIDVASEVRKRYGKEYIVYSFNKYKTSALSLIDSDYDLIVDNNLKQHACCEEHWVQYFHAIVSKLSKGGMLLTHTQGFAPHTDRVSWLSVEELQDLCDSRQGEFDLFSIFAMSNNSGHYPLVVKKL